MVSYIVNDKLFQLNQARAISPDMSGPGSNGNEVILHITQSFWAEAWTWDCLVIYPEHSLGSEILSLYRGAVGVFYISSWLDDLLTGYITVMFVFLGWFSKIASWKILDVTVLVWGTTYLFLILIGFFFFVFCCFFSLRFGQISPLAFF